VGAVVIKAGHVQPVWAGHPWVFAQAVDRIEGGAAPGEDVEVRDARGNSLGRGLYSPGSAIVVRLYTRSAEARVDGALFADRIARAVERRTALDLPSEQTSAVRLVNAEGDDLPGLIVDRYADFVVCQFLAAGADAWRSTLAEALLELCSATGVYERSESGLRRKEGLQSQRGLLLGSEPPAVIEVQTPPTRHLVDIVNGQKTGTYLDQQWNRARVAAYARDARVLDAFAYTGGFAIACLRAGAAGATLIETSAEALRVAERDAELNAVAGACELSANNVFDELRVLRDAERQFGLVVLDPPKFVHSADQLRSGSRGYKDINLLGLQLVKPGGILATFSCSGHVDGALFQKIVAGAALDAGRDAQILERLSQPPDHPVALEFPEGEYLKGLILRVH